MKKPKATDAEHNSPPSSVNGKLSSAPAGGEELPFDPLLILDSIPALVSYVDADERFRRVNRAYEEFFGRRREEILGRTVHEVTGDVHYSLAASHIKRALAGERVAYESRVRRQDGSIRDIALTYTPDIAIDGRVCGFVAMVQDVTERKRAEAALQASEHHLAVLLDSMPECVKVLGPGGELLQMNRAGLRMIEAETPAQAIGSCVYPLINEPYREAFKEVNETVFNGGPGGALEFVVTGLKGTERTLETRVVPLRNENEAVVGALSTTRDVTERKRMEAELRESEARFRGLTEALPLLVWTSLPDGSRDYSNDRWPEYTGQSLQESYGAGWMDVVHPGDHERVREVFRNAFNSRHGYETRYRIRRVADGEWRWHLVRAFPLRDENGTHVKWIGSGAEIHDQVEAAEQLSFALRAADMGDWSWNAATDKVSMSERAAQIFEIAPGPTMTWTEMQSLLHPDDRERVRDEVLRVIGARTHYDIEYRLVNGNAIRWVSAKGRASYDAHGVATGMHGVVQDITSRKTAEEQRRYHAELTRTIADNASGTLVMLDTQGRVTYINPAGEQMTGFKGDEVTGQVLHGLIHHHTKDGEAYPIERCPLVNVLRLRTRLEGHEDVFFRKDGSSFPVRCYASPILTDGEPVGTVIEIRDLTGERRARDEREDLLRRERQARQTAELLNTIGPIVAAELDTSKLAQKVTDLATELTGAAFGALFHNVLNEQGESYTLYTLSGVPREAFAQFPMPRNTHVFGPTFRGEGVVRSPDITKDPRYGHNPPYKGMPEGHLPVRSYLAAPVISRSGTVLGGLFFGHPRVDMFTEQHEQVAAGIAAQAAIALDNAHLFAEAQRVQTALRRSNEELRRANEDLEQFAYSASHDLQEPLRMVSIYGEMLRRKHRDSLTGQARQYLDFATQGAQKMELLVKDLLAYTRAVNVNEGEAEPVDAGSALADALANLGAAVADSGAHVSAGPLPTVLAGRVHLVQLFQNLIGNAIKYRSDAPPRIRVYAAQDASMWRICVEDNGIGIPPEYAKHVFGIFRRLHTADKYEGTGIGLAICQKIVERYGGTIFVEPSESGRGSRFCFTLPGPAESAS